MSIHSSIHRSIRPFHSIHETGKKFGAEVQDCEKLLRIAHKLKLKIIGVSFHVGSGCSDVSRLLG